MIDHPTALIIGQGEMPVQCARLLKRAGYFIACVHSPDEPLKRWAAENDVAWDNWQDFRAWASGLHYHYLFSIINFRILPPEVYERPVMAINYHDAPLPRYAGSHAIKWALHNREKEHGVTWHVITRKVDAGDILKQRKFAISETDDEASVAQKCYLAGMRSFAELIQDLKVDSIQRAPQDLSQRTFYAASAIPAL